MSRRRALAVALAVGLATGCHRKPARSALPDKVAVTEFAWATKAAPVRDEPKGASPARWTVKEGARVPLRSRVVRGGIAWAEIRGEGLRGGWVESSALSSSRTTAAPREEKPRTVVTGGTGSVRRAGKDAELIDRRALDAEKTNVTSPTSPRLAADDFATLQVITDELYLDPVSWQPSPERRKHDAAEFRKGAD